VLTQLGLADPIAQGLTAAYAVGLGSLAGGSDGAAAGANEVLNNSLLAPGFIMATIQNGGESMARACLASPDCVALIGDKNAATLFVSVQVSDAINQVTAGMQDITGKDSAAKNFRSSGGAAGAHAFMDQLPVIPESLEIAPNGAELRELTDGSVVSFYLESASGKEPSVSIRRPDGYTIKIRFGL
jgi:hypothetical protein